MDANHHNSPILSSARELETNDIDYTYKYLKMPEIVMELEDSVSRIESKITGYADALDKMSESW